MIWLHDLHHTSRHQSQTQYTGTDSNSTDSRADHLNLATVLSTILVQKKIDEYCTRIRVFLSYFSIVQFGK